MEMVFYHQSNRRDAVNEHLPDDSVKDGILKRYLGESIEGTAAAHPGTGGLWKTSCRAAALFAAASILLLAGLVTLLFCLSSSGSKEEVERAQFQTSYSNRTGEEDQLRRNYDNATKERDHILSEYNRVVKEREQLQTSYNNLAKESEQLQTSYNNRNKGRDQLQASYNNLRMNFTNLTLKRDNLAKRYNNMSKERAQLQISYNNLSKEREQLQINYNHLAKEGHRVQMSLTNLTSERDNLQKSCNNMSKERDEFQKSNNTLVKERDQTSYNSLRAKQHQLENNLTQQRDQLVWEKGPLQGQAQVIAKENTDLQAKLQASEASLRNLTQERTSLNTMLKRVEQEGWVYFRGSFYYVSSTKATWQISRNYCRQKDSDLLVIDSRDEQDFANKFKKYVWIGLTDSETEGTWRWVDGTLPNTWYWSSREPNGRKTENCGDIKNYNAENSWNDENCDILLFWICEKKLILN
ncbi:uncharacterized protein LOC142902564 [Nelusetta ayraudi]|uniref:uncharacterized protein LOC142902564 n=1 Tax=Nelusetta ayraudi TaxID=303726 RepID=UPI003F71DEC1